MVLEEKNRLRLNYGIRDLKIKQYMRRCLTRGEREPWDKMVQIMESRADSILFRTGIARDMAQAAYMVNSGHVQVKYPEGHPARIDWPDWFRICWSSYELCKGMQFRVYLDEEDPSKSEPFQKLCRENMPKVGNVKIPSHIDFDKERMAGTYIQPCRRSEFPINFDQDRLFENFTGRGWPMIKSIRRPHNRWWPGTNKKIKQLSGRRVRKYYITKSPENLMNMQRGIGLNATGRLRPPCLWGRKKPAHYSYLDMQKAV